MHASCMYMYMQSTAYLLTLSLLPANSCPFFITHVFAVHLYTNMMWLNIAARTYNLTPGLPAFSQTNVDSSS